MQSKKSLQFNNTDIWVKKNGDPDFDVTMESFDGTELASQWVDIFSTFWVRIMENIGQVSIAMTDQLVLNIPADRKLIEQEKIS